MVIEKILVTSPSESAVKISAITAMRVTAPTGVPVRSLTTESPRWPGMTRSRDRE
jgi:hypothetical protein